jgi:hypothetical protein
MLAQILKHWFWVWSFSSTKPDALTAVPTPFPAPAPNVPSFLLLCSTGCLSHQDMGRWRPSPGVHRVA